MIIHRPINSLSVNDTLTRETHYLKRRDCPLQSYNLTSNQLLHDACEIPDRLFSRLPDSGLLRGSDRFE
uniref:Uncharacterized protein n=1 Tax=Trichobilharzia regenti TaxID=157069 RepID=A0AA85KGL8_TRIRE|nr:unnamed protein product [Trichobilharzia regenti]